MNEDGLDEPVATVEWEEIDLAELDRLTPIAVIPGSPEPSVAWMDLLGEPLDAPFFSDVVASFQRRNPESLILSTGIEALDAAAADSTGWSPAGFVFHLSRCGSTAVARSLASSRRLLVISEPGPVNVIASLAERSAAGEERLRSRLRGLLWAITRPYRSERPHCIVKLSSWNALLLPVFIAAFPEVPWVFLYRDPVEVMVSLVQSPPGWMEDHFHPLDLVATGRGVVTDPEESMAITLGEICGAVLAAENEKTALVNYRDLSPGVIAEVLTHFQIPVSVDEITAMSASLRMNAKRPERGVFIPDSEDKLGQASHRLIELVSRWVQAPYERLEDRRRWSNSRKNLTQA